MKSSACVVVELQQEQSYWHINIHRAAVLLHQTACIHTTGHVLFNFTRKNGMVLSCSSCIPPMSVFLLTVLLCSVFLSITEVVFISSLIVENVLLSSINVVKKVALWWVELSQYFSSVPRSCHDAMRQATLPAGHNTTRETTDVKEMSSTMLSVQCCELSVVLFFKHCT
eukprot:scpid36278/ scgid32877/ 